MLVCRLLPERWGFYVVLKGLGKLPSLPFQWNLIFVNDSAGDAVKPRWSDDGGFAGFILVRSSM